MTVRPTCKTLLTLLSAAGLLAVALSLQGEDPPVSKPLLDDTPRYWKGNLHTHSFWSDGDDFPEMIADWYKRNGYHFLAMTDHNVLSDGERWIDVAKPEKSGALKKYQARFGDAWVERREEKGVGQVRLKPLAEFRSTLEEPGRF